MTNKIHITYFAWLSEQVDHKELYSNLNSFLHNRCDFRWRIEMDKNREDDGYYLREGFLRFADGVGLVFSKSAISSLLSVKVSVFEVLVAISYRIEFELDDLSSAPKFHIWYTELITNLGLAENINELWALNVNRSELQVGEVIDTLLDRTYTRAGLGSLFPVKHTTEDMRMVEIWYQMMLYLYER